MKKKPDFRRDLKIGEQAEEWVKDALFLDSYAQASKDKYHDIIDADNKIEIKYDKVAARTGNFFFEIISNLRAGNLGACIYSKADTMCLVLDTAKDNIKEMLFIDFEKLRFLGMSKIAIDPDSIRTVYGNENCYGVLVEINKIREKANKRMEYDTACLGKKAVAVIG